MNSLIGLHCFTGCDTVSAFAGKGKIKPFNLMKTNADYVDIFASLGNYGFVDDLLYERIEKFVSPIWKEKCKFN